MKNNFPDHIVRKATVKDANSIWKVRTLAIRGISEDYYRNSDMEKWSPEIMPADFAKYVEKYEWVVVEVQKAIVSTGCLDFDQKSVEGMFTIPQYQGNGFAKQILKKIESIAKELGIEKVTLDSTLAAEKFYEKNGFQKLEKAKYHSPMGITLDCIKMEKILA